jgi:predicted porin
VRWTYAAWASANAQLHSVRKARAITNNRVTSSNTYEETLMKRKNLAIVSMIAAAAIGASLPAQAQSSVQIYGRVDLGVQSTSAQNPSAGAKFAVVSGNRTGSRLGFRVTEDLGGGLKAQATLEAGLNADTGSFAQGGLAFGRESLVTLSGRPGTVGLGRAGSFGSGTGTFDMIGDTGAFGTGWGDASLFSTSRVDNSIFYVTPKLGDFSVGVMHSFAVEGPEASPRSANAHLTGLGVNYDAKPFYAALVYEVVNNPAAGAPNEEHVLAGVRWNAGLVRLYLSAMHSKNQFSGGVASNSPDSTQYHVGASMKVGAAGELIVGYYDMNGKRRGTTERDETRIAVGYEHSLSKRTSLYAAVTDRNGKKSLNNSSTDRRRVNMGVLHRF